MNSSENSNNRSRDRPSFRNGGYTWNLYGSERFDVGGVSDKKTTSDSNQKEPTPRSEKTIEFLHLMDISLNS